MHITIVAGARPNFMKIAPIIRAISNRNIGRLSYRLVHTGQHYDHKMSGAFFEQLNIPEPHVNLNAGSGTQAEQTAAMMVGFEKELHNHKTDLVIVVGDVTSTMACTIVAKKLCIPVAHVEAGIRSGDNTMPEEINRMVTDAIADYFFTTTPQASKNLEKSGISSNRIFFVGNTMIDTLLYSLPSLMCPQFLNEIINAKEEYLVITLHRPNNVDDSNKLKEILNAITKNSSGVKKIFPVHPRTAKQIENIGIDIKDILLLEPMTYFEFIYLIKNSRGIITDSGGITEEATVLGIPCMTLRNSTERPETVNIGTNELIGSSPQNIGKYLEIMLSGKWKKGEIPEKWDGKTAERILDALLDIESTLLNSD